MANKLNIAAIVLSIAALAVSLFGIFRDTGAAREQEDVQYVLYLGTNHKDTNQPVFTPEEAKHQVENILLDHFGGYTIQEAQGGWIDGANIYTEYTLVIYLSDTTAAQVHAAADEMIDVFCQSSVLIQENKTNTEFYAGKQ